MLLSWLSVLPSQVSTFFNIVQYFFTFFNIVQRILTCFNIFHILQHMTCFNIFQPNPAFFDISKFQHISTYSSSTAQGGGGSFKNKKPIGEVGCCESRMAERSH